MRIAIDARFYGEAGPGRYCSELLRNLEKVDHENDYTVFLKASNFDSFKPSNPHFKKVLADFHWYSLAEQMIFPWLLYRGNFDLVHFTQINVPLVYFKPFVVTVHDVILHEFSTERGSIFSRLFYKLKKVPYHLIFAKDIYLSKLVIVPSRTTKGDLLKYYPIRENNISVIYESVDHYPSSADVRRKTEVLEKYGIRKPYILTLGSFYPHKNVQGLIKVYEVLRERGNFTGQLVVVGKESYFSKKLRDFVVEEKAADVIFPAQSHPQGYLSDIEVETILANAFLYVHPAFKEGFGIPPVEAMVFGVPTAVSDIPCLREMCSDASVYFDPENVAGMVSQIKRIVENELLRRELIRKGFENIKRFSWRKMAEETLSVYRSCLSG